MKLEKQKPAPSGAGAGILERSSRSEPQEHNMNNAAAQAVHFLPSKPKAVPQYIENPGVRRAVEKCAGSEVVRWPSDRKLQFNAFEAWLDVAMQILDRSKKSFRLVAVYRSFLFWKTGEIHASDAQLAERAGRCSVRTISREIAAHRALGLISVEHGWRVLEGRRLRTRVIRLAFPTPTPSFVVLGDTDIRVSTWIDGQDRHTGGETEQTHGCLITLDHKEGGHADG